MTIAAGTRLGPYEVIAPVGAGGMGEVYRARDTRLDREVAIKVLPESIAAREDVRARFEREAKAISALNHPNICTLYDVGSEGDVEYLVMELLNGETLASVLTRGRLPLDRTLRYAIEIATALDRAHRQGIVHRDLKPGNVMITKGGVKLLDFGLARSAAPLGRHDATTVVNPITEEGMVLGTLEYMSPEQLEGKPTDARTDLFSFGCILYEMITGRRAFGGGSSASLITAIMSSQPPAIATLVPVTPPALERLVTKCLEKNPDDRWQNAGDLAIELKWIAESPEQAAPAKKQRRGVILFLGFVTAVFAFWGAFVAWRLGKRGITTPPLMRFSLPTGAEALGIDLLGASISISPDGRSVVYVARAKGKSMLWRRSLAEATAAPIEKTEDAAEPFWSPDSQQIAFAAHGKLVRIPATGGDISKICDISPGAEISGAWSRDGSIVFGELGGRPGLLRVPAGGGTPQNIPIPDSGGQRPALSPQFLADGDHLAYTTVGTGADLRLHLFSLRSGQDRDLGPTDSQIQLVGDVMFFVRDGSLFAVHVDRDLKRLDEPALITSDLNYYVTLGAGHYRASEQAIVFSTATTDAHLTWFNRRGENLGTVGPDGADGRARISMDGKKAVTRIYDPLIGTADLWICDLGRNVSMRLTSTRSSEGMPVLSPDGKTIAFLSDRDGPPHVFTMSAGGGNATAILPLNKRQYVTDWTPDGRKLLVEELDPAMKTNLMLCDAKPGSRLVPWLATPFDENSARFSHDGKWVAYISDASGRMEAYVTPFDRPTEAIQISNGGASDVAWSANGREVFYCTDTAQIYAVALRTSPALDAAPAQLLFRDETAEFHELDVAPDGRFLVPRAISGPLTRPLNVIVNWRQLLDSPH